MLGYDARQRLVSDDLRTPGGTSIAKLTYGYDSNGNETSKTTTGFAGSATNTYGYDRADRLILWFDGITNTNYTYDRSGNRISVGTRTFAYDQRNQLLKLGDQLTVPAKREVCLDAPLQGRQPLLLQPCDLGLRERLERQVGERRAAPHGQPAAERRR